MSMYDTGKGLIVGPFRLRRMDEEGGGIWMERNEKHEHAGEGAQMSELALADHLEKFYREHF